ncbi:MAG: uroporphyrinogen decarboxylase family protein [Phycisphaerae bacterium]|jgi:uroporphyrinogen decarboxylase
MTSRERVACALARRPPDRVPITDWFWKETELDFVRQLNDPRLGAGINSASPANYDLLTLWEYFDMDFMQVAWPDQRLRLVPPTVVEETDDWVLQRDGNDALLRWWKNKGGTPEHVSFGIDTPEKWAAVKPLLTASRERIRWPEFWPRYHRARERDRFVFYAGVEIIESVKDVLGHEMMLRAMIKQPEWVHDVFDTFAQFEIDMFRLAEAEGMVCDGAFIYADIAYKNGPFMSPRHYREFVQPYHRRFFDEFHRRDMPVVVHSDGDIRALLPAFLENGVTAINPLEARANMDVRELVPQYGERLGFVGNIDVTVLTTNDRDRIHEELQSKLRAAMPYHGYIYHSDHSIPPGVTLETYQWLLSEVRRLGRYD